MKIKALEHFAWVTKGKVYETYEDESGDSEKYFYFIDDDNGKQQRLKQWFEVVEDENEQATL